MHDQDITTGRLRQSVIINCGGIDRLGINRCCIASVHEGASSVGRELLVPSEPHASLHRGYLLYMQTSLQKAAVPNWNWPTNGPSIRVTTRRNGVAVERCCREMVNVNERHIIFLREILSFPCDILSYVIQLPSSQGRRCVTQYHDVPLIIMQVDTQAKTYSCIVSPWSGSIVARC